MKLRDALIAWNRYGEIEVGLLAENRRTDWSERYELTDGGCYTHVAKARGDAAKVYALAAFHATVVRDGVSIADAHREFWKIDEYRDAIAPDVGECLAPPPAEEPDTPVERASKLYYMTADECAAMALR